MLWDFYGDRMSVYAVVRILLRGLPSKRKRRRAMGEARNHWFLCEHAYSYMLSLSLFKIVMSSSLHPLIIELSPKPKRKRRWARTLPFTRPWRLILLLLKNVDIHFHTSVVLQSGHISVLGMQITCFNFHIMHLLVRCCSSPSFRFPVFSIYQLL
jgi:hypothetical protein